MNNKIAQFEKVTFDEFKKAFEDVTEENIFEMYTSICLPKRATTRSAGYDIFAPFDFELKPQETIKIPTGLRVKIDGDWFLGVFPRSGLGFKYRLQLDNTVGIIDADYYDSDNQGHIFIKITNDSKTDKVLQVKQGQGFAQGIFIPFGLVYEDDVTAQRNGGFGSTTK